MTASQILFASHFVFSQRLAVVMEACFEASINESGLLSQSLSQFAGATSCEPLCHLAQIEAAVQECGYFVVLSTLLLQSESEMWTKITHDLTPSQL